MWHHSLKCETDKNNYRMVGNGHREIIEESVIRKAQQWGLKNTVIGTKSFVFHLTTHRRQNLGSLTVLGPFCRFFCCVRDKYSETN